MGNHDSYSDTSQNIFDAIISIGIIIYAVAQWQNSKADKKSTEDKDALVTLALKDKAIETLSKELERVNAIVIQDGKDIAVLQAENTRLANLNANRSPELESLLEKVVTALNKQTESINALLAKQPIVAINNQPHGA
jgi:hypothetical protein